MKYNDLNICPGSLSEGHTTYSTQTLKKMFGGKKVHPTLPYNSPISSKETKNFLENVKHISISGFQEKYSLILDKTNLRLTQEGESGEYILKPIPLQLKNSEFAPANEHLTMQIAKQIFKIETAENALIFFKDNSPAYLTKRFDINKNGKKLAVEDFASLLGKTPQTSGEQYKYNGSYYELFQAMQKHLSSWKVETPKLFTLILFNYLFSNGDAHFKNFSIIETDQGDYKLSPAYDLMNTKIHIDDSEFALNNGLLPASLKKGNIGKQFFELGRLIGLNDKMIEKILLNLTSNNDKVLELVNRSFLSDKLKRNYIQAYQRRLKKIKIFK